MKAKQLIDGLHILPGLVNVYLLKTKDGYALIDSGFPNSAVKILKSLDSIGVAPKEVKHLLLTHCHPDHMGSAAALKRETGATVYAHAEDAEIIRSGTGFRKAIAAPGLRNRIMFKILTAASKDIEGTPVDCLIADGESLPFDKDLVAIHIPGHCAGQLAFLWKRNGGVLFTADACINRGGMKITAAIEDLEETRRSLAKLATHTFQAACFGHGSPIMTGADASFRKTWSTLSRKNLDRLK